MRFVKRIAALISASLAVQAQTTDAADAEELNRDKDGEPWQYCCQRHSNDHRPHAVVFRKINERYREEETGGDTEEKR